MLAWPVRGQSKPAREGRRKTSHFEGHIALSAVGTEPDDPNPITSRSTFKKTFGGENKKIETGGESLEPVVRDSETE